MFKHIFIYRLKVLLRSKSMIFWTLFFPIALSILFYFAFSGLRTTDSFHSIPVAYVEETENPVFSSLLEVLSQENELFDLTVMDESTAKDALESNEITGYFQSKETVTLKVASNGMDQSILKSFLDRYEQTSATIERIALTSDLSALDWDALYEDTPVSINQTPISNSELDLILSFFYALIAMTCFYGGYFGLEEIIHIQGDLSKLGARLNISPVHKLKTLLYSLSASAFIVILEMSVFLLFLSTVLKVAFAEHTFLVVLTTFIGSMTGISFGAFIAATVKGSENVKNGILTGLTMLGAFLSGMMIYDIKYIIQSNAPIVAKLNPLHLISDAYYSLYYFDDYSRYIENMVGLFAYMILFSTITYFVIRRRKYAGI